MAVTQTIWVLQWERYTGIAKSQGAPPEFWEQYKNIKVPSNGQITEAEVVKLKALMAKFQLSL
jgi:hypothetical protein